MAPAPVLKRAGVDLDEAMAPGALVSAFQPLVELASGATVGFEALARWPGITGADPDTVFPAARAAGRSTELDWMARLSGLRGALDAGLGTDQTLFINVEAASFGAAQPAAARELIAQALAGLRVVLELTERSLLSRPADLLALIGWARDHGWGVALDDVGAHPDSLALLPFVAPDVIKLDLALVQQTPSQYQARTMAAIMAHAERSGAVILAEGIETESHLEQAFAFGATYGQGWLFGRPGPLVASPSGTATSRLPFREPNGPVARTPFDLVAARVGLRVGRKPLLQAMSRHIESQAMAQSDPPVVLAAFQTAERFTPALARRYAALADVCPFVGALGAGLPSTPATGVSGADLAPDDGLRGEWTVVVVGPHYAGALIARDLGDDGPDRNRRFEFTITHQRDIVVAAGRSLMARILASGR
jgi:EAL domain-containing protein (putative c-di-GMP-specific phosphodiesterase class I)